MRTYKDIYKLPLKRGLSPSWVYDQNDNFVFQFVNNSGRHDRLIENQNEIEQSILDRINDKGDPIGTQNWAHKDGYIGFHPEGWRKDTFVRTLLIRGWGNLTGVGGHNIDPEEAANIQDTFEEFVVEQINKKD